MENPLYQFAPDGTCLIETLGYRRDEGYRYLNLQLARLQRSVQALEFKVDIKAVRTRLQAIKSATPLRCRLTVAQDGHCALHTTPLQEKTLPWSVAIAPQRLVSDDQWLRHKTTQRAFYDDMRAALPVGVDEWLFFNERDELCEGTITNIFIIKANGKIITPASNCGVLLGIFRQTLLAKGLCTER